MPMSTDASELPPPGAQDLWLALTASQLGAAHQATGLPNQDAVAVRQVRPDVLVAAVADGHGHRRHFRSARGSQLAVTVACEAAQELAARLDGFQTAAPIESEALGALVPAITGEWREAVREDVAADPFTSGEDASRGGDDPLIAYGSTLLLAIAGRRWLLLVQIGDGDIMGIQPDGRPLLPVPRDPSLDGQLTTSLCGPGAEDEFRAAVVDTSTTPLLGVMLATDGYGNAQLADPWTDAVSADLAELINDRPPEWLAGQLPLWASRCASADGSADDTTIALLIAPSATGWRHDVPDEPAADATTTAARRLAEPATESVMETRLRLLLVLAGLPRPDAQIPLHDDAGRFVGRPDLYYPLQHLALEYDGSTHRERLTADNRRQNRMINAGYRLLRFSAADVLSAPDSVVSLVKQALHA